MNGIRNRHRISRNRCSAYRLSPSVIGLFAFCLSFGGGSLRAEALSFGDWASSATAAEAPAFNLSDCMRDTNRKDWPASYVLACGDLNGPVAPAAARTVEEKAPALRQRILTIPSVPAAKVVAAAGVALKPAIVRVAAVPVERMAPVLIRAVALAPSAALIPAVELTAVVTPSAPQCMVDEKGRTTTGLLDGTRPRQTVPVKTQMLSSGVVLLVPTSCIVKSPIAGKVLFAGIFKGYRGVVILNIGRGRQMIVAGLGTLNVLRGDVVTRGMTIGSTSNAGAPALATAFGGTSDTNRSLLYFDLKTAKGASKNVFLLADAR